MDIIETERIKKGVQFRPLKTKLTDGYYIEGHFVPPKDKTTLLELFLVSKTYM